MWWWYCTGHGWHVWHSCTWYIMAWYGTQYRAPCLTAAIIIAAYVAPGGLERAGGCGLGHLCMSRAYMRTCVRDSTWVIAHLLLRPVAVAAQEGPGEGRGGGGEVSPCTAVVSHWSMASGCKNWLINVPQICSRGGVPSLNSRSPAGRVSSVSTGSGCIFWFQRCTWGFASRAVRKFLGTPAFASSPLWRAVGRNIARRSQNGESNQMRFAICDWTPRGCQERFRLGRPVGGPQSRLPCKSAFRCLLNHLPRAARTCDPDDRKMSFFVSVLHPLPVRSRSVIDRVGLIS